MDIWIAAAPGNADRLMSVLDEFGFANTGVSRELLMTPGKVIAMGVRPVRIELLNQISGVAFDGCYARRIVGDLDGVPANILCVEDLRTNKRSAGRPKDLADLDNLP